MMIIFMMINFIIIVITDEMKLDKKMISDATMHAADVSEKIDLPTLIVGILTKQILPDSTVLGFSRSGDFLIRDLLKEKAEVFTIKDIDSDDVETIHRNISYGKDETLEPLNPPVQTETSNRATGSDKDATGVVEEDVEGADIERDSGIGESVENVSVRGDGVRCWIKSDMKDIYISRTLQTNQSVGTASGVILNLLSSGETFETIISRRRLIPVKRCYHLGLGVSMEIHPTLFCKL